MGNTPEYRPWPAPCSWIALAVMLVPWWMMLSRVIADVLAVGAKNAAFLGQQVAWAVAGLILVAMLFRKQLRLIVSRGRVLEVLIFSLLWPYFLQGFEQGPKGTDVVTTGVVRAEVVLSLVVLVIVALVMGEVIRLPKGSRPWIRWRLPDDSKDRKRHKARKRDNDPGIAGSAAWWARRHTHDR